MHWAEAGEGETVLFLHGFPESWYSWRHQLSALAPHYRVVAPDMRGYNDTEARGPYDTATLQQDVLALIRELGVSRVHLVGHDWGGAVGWLLAINHQDVLLSWTACNIPHPSIFARQLRRNFRQLRRSWYVFFFQVPWLPEHLLAFQGYHRLASGLINDCKPGTFTREDMKEILRGWRKHGLGPGVNWYRAALRHPARLANPVPMIEVPTMMVWGEDDIALGKELTYGTAEFARDFAIHYLPNTSHWVQQEEPATVNQLLLNHLRHAEELGRG